MKRERSAKFFLGLLALLAAVPRTRAQYRDWLDQQQANLGWDTLPRLEYLRTDVEAEQDNLHSAGAFGNQDTTRLYVSPRIGIGWNNYIYHPYFLTYSLLFEPGYVWQNRTSNGNGVTSDQLILNGTFKANILQVKPYATTLSYSRAHQEAKYGFFDTAMVESQSWGAMSGYREGPVPVEVSFLQSHEDATDFSQKTLTDQTLLNLHAHNYRDRDNATQLDYLYSQFNRETKGAGYDFTTKNAYNYASLTDVEHFERSDLKSSAQLNAVDSNNKSSSTAVNTLLNYTVDHGLNLHSYYDYSFSLFTGNHSDAIQNYGVAGIQHQLFESLSSSAEVHGTQLSSSGGGSTFDSQSIGTTLSANYTKRLGSWGHLYLDNSTSYNITSQQASGSLQINNESHVVPTNAVVRLSQPRDTAVVSIADASFRPLQPADYTLIRSTDPWQIQINIVGPSHVQPGSTVLVTYTVQTNPSGDFSIFANQAQLRVTFWGDRIGIFALYQFSDSHASSPALLLQNDQLFEVGADFTWRGLGVAGNCTDEHSTFYDNRSYNLAEGYAMNVSSHSVLGINLNQQWNVNSSAAVGGVSALPKEHSTFYNFMLSYEWHPVSSLNWAAEIGYQRQEGFGLDQNLFAARTYLNWWVGKLQFHAGYQHENQELTNQKREQDFIFLRALRTF